MNPLICVSAVFLLVTAGYIQDVTGATQSTRCLGKNDGCCTKNKPCFKGEGDCDNDNQCAGHLTCGRDNCAWKRWDNSDDCCQGKRCTGHHTHYTGCCTKETPCGLGEGDCDNSAECGAFLKCNDNLNNCRKFNKKASRLADCCVPRCTGENDGCCTKEKPCGKGQGDCDHHNQCAGSLKCGTDNCAWKGSDNSDDCCYGVRCNGQNSGCCTKATPCGIGEGDCDNDDDCEGSLVCGENNCAWKRWDNSDDCCEVNRLNVETSLPKGFYGPRHYWWRRLVRISKRRGDAPEEKPIEDASTVEEDETEEKPVEDETSFKDEVEEAIEEAIEEEQLE